MNVAPSNPTVSGSRSFRTITRWILPVLATATVAVVGVLCFREVERVETKNVEAKLTTILEAAIKGLTIWTDAQKRNANYIAARPDTRRLAAALVRLADEGVSNQRLLNSPEQSDLGRFIAEANETLGYTNYAVVSQNGRILSDSLRQYVGRQVPPSWEQYLPLVFAGETVMAKPYPAVFEARDAEVDQKRHETLMFVAAPIRDESGAVIAAIGFGIRPEAQFTEILTVARAGDTGETYAFSEDGWMLSDSRFDEQLKAFGLLSKENSVLNVRLGDPEVDLAAGGKLSKPVGSLALTEIIAGTLAAKANNDFDVLSIPSGYSDYRGVKAVAVGKWLPEFDFGITTKIDYQEAYAPRILIRNVLGVLFGLAMLGLAASLLYRFALTDIQRRMKRAVREIERLGQYTLEDKIGEGGMGEVYRASHAMLRRPTAVKLLRPERSSEAAIARFEREVQLTAGLTHPNTIAIYDYGRTPEGVFYYAMEFLDGLDLNRVVARDGPQPGGRVISVLQQVCASLREAHDAGLIHRDIKPANIILCERGGLKDVVKVLDFGLVKESDVDQAISRDNVITGTPVYMSPESIHHPESVDARSDIYAVGAVGYFLLTGTDVFTGRNAIEVMHNHIAEAVTPPTERLGRPVDSDVSEVIMRCLEKAPQGRPQSVAELSQSLGNCLAAGAWTQAQALAWWEEYSPVEGELRSRESSHPLPVTISMTKND